MTCNRYRQPALALTGLLLLAAVLSSSCRTVRVAPDLGAGRRALREIRAEGGLVFPKGTEFRFHKERIDTGGGGTLTLTLIVDDTETLDALSAPIDNPILMYHVAK